MARRTTTDLRAGRQEMRGTGVRRWLTAGIALVAAATLAAGCSSGSSDSSTTTAAPTSTTKAGLSATAVRALQSALTKVGCYSGAIDGAIGPMTTAAVRAFQSAAGLTADGIYGARTQVKLLADQASGLKVCTTTTSTTGTAVTTTTAATTVSAPCTSVAVGKALPAGENVVTFTCAQGWAGGSMTNGTVDSAYLLVSTDGAWAVAPATACSTAVIPAAVKAVSPCKVS